MGLDFEAAWKETLKDNSSVTMCSMLTTNVKDVANGDLNSKLVVTLSDGLTFFLSLKY